MKTTAILVLCLSTSLLAAQKRVNKTPPTFDKSVQAALTAYEAKRYTAAIDSLQEAIGVAMEKRREMILAALPPAPAGWSKVPQKKDANQANPFAAMAATMGDVIEQQYRQDGGQGQVTITITADSPLLQMFSMMLQNPQMVPDGELIEYESNKAILKKEGSNNVLQMVLLERNMIECKGRGIDGDRVLEIMNQAVVDALTTALGN